MQTHIKNSLGNKKKKLQIFLNTGATNGHSQLKNFTSFDQDFRDQKETPNTFLNLLHGTAKKTTHLLL